jgi:hypothetical protein
MKVILMLFLPMLASAQNTDYDKMIIENFGYIVDYKNGKVITADPNHEYWSIYKGADHLQNLRTYKDKLSRELSFVKNEIIKLTRSNDTKIKNDWDRIESTVAIKLHLVTLNIKRLESFN